MSYVKSTTVALSNGPAVTATATCILSQWHQTIIIARQLLLLYNSAFFYCHNADSVVGKSCGYIANKFCVYNFFTARRYAKRSKCHRRVGWVEIRHFQRKTSYNSKTVQDRCIVSIKVEEEVICALSNVYVSDDPNFCIFRRLSYLRSE